MRNLTFSDKNTNPFQTELLEVVSKYPSLKIITEDNFSFLRGIIDIPDDDGSIIYSFFIEIHDSEYFPLGFPTLFEIGGEIPNEADWHKYEDGSCCITVPQDEKIICRNGITINLFIKNHVIPFFANYLYRKEKGHYKNGEYKHGFKGFEDFYKKLFKSEKISDWKRDVDYAFGQKNINLNRNDKCYCGSGLKYKKCHYLTFYELQFLGEVNVKKDLLNIIKTL
jgi:hypothetical protein